MVRRRRRHGYRVNYVAVEVSVTAARLSNNVRMILVQVLLLHAYSSSCNTKSRGARCILFCIATVTFNNIAFSIAVEVGLSIQPLTVLGPR